MTTDRRIGELDRRVLRRDALGLPCASPSAPPPPRQSRRTRRRSRCANERFIALHHEIERMKPAAPSSAPAMISTLFPMREPRRRGRQPGVRVQQRDHHRHVAAANRQHHRNAEEERQRQHAVEGRPVPGFDDQRAERTRTPRRSAVRFTAFCPLKVIGRPVMSSCSLPNAMNDPVTVSAPNSTSNPSAAASPCVSPSSPRRRCARDTPPRPPAWRRSRRTRARRR